MRQFLLIATLLALCTPAARAQSITRVASVPASTVLDIAVSGNRACLANFGNNTLDIYDVSVPTAPVLRSSTQHSLRIHNVAAVGNKVYSIGYASGNITMASVYAFDISNPAAPVGINGALLSTPTAQTQPPTMVASASFVCVAGMPNGVIHIYDSNMNVLGTYSGASGDMSLNGNVLYLRNNSFTTILDLSNPALPVNRGSLPITITSVQGTKGYGVQNATLRIYDVSSPLAPLLLGSVANNGGNQVAVSGTTVFTNSGGIRSSPVGNRYTLQAFDASTPGAPVLRATEGGLYPYESVGALSANGNNLAFIVDAANLNVFSFRATATATRAAAPPALACYPNPAHASLQLPYTKAGTLVTVHDLTGRVCLTTPLAADGLVNIGSLPAGLYSLRAGQATQKLVVE
ncbi:T9SS type A sorting domain-containing protein [Hymenobacter negativus]|uniref:T9SS type A sorting domain-containing protein n=1 Tax=Hymenobacter negativus TaxID=2795026 RepID=A0ABS0Q9S1_9BACT|nr:MULTISPECIES: T9SS type A sorting domain-containing protein [Bacteria]MBH8559408.1 T9SS type A sorting domain-containing protein [Hymenobacter negativus]MBH8568340.1 T9SS type A sorting domain-containing protein [Hymenobacter negativus]MBR7208075.1 T9SS type A sorting domain-containing protein [Microvirga sp. STS02]